MNIIKLKIYSLNDLDLIAQKRNDEVLNLLNSKVDEFIIDSKDFITEKYILFFKNDVSIEKNFTGIVREEILDNLIELREDFNNNYLNLMNEYFKDKLITIYTKAINEKTKNMVTTVEDSRESLKVKIDDIFSLDPDEVLNDINKKMNYTLNSINKYNNHFDTFKISDNLGNFLNNYGTINIQPKFSRVLDILNEVTKYEIIDTIDKNSEEFINYFDIEEFLKKISNIHNKINKNYIENLNTSIFNYGIDEYPNNLESEILRQTNLHEKQNQRILNEKEIDNINQEKIADKAIDEIFKRILISSLNAKTFIYSLEKFGDFDDIINEYINKLNIDFKKSLKRIKDNNYPEDIYNNLTLRLSELKNSSLDYYNNIKINYHKLKNYLQNSINEINNDLNKCANITYITFAEKYENYTNMDNINSTNNENLEEIIGSDIAENQGKITRVNYTITNIKKDTEFLFKIDYEDGEIKKPRVNAIIINKSKPKIISLKFINEEGDEIERINAEINNVNFTMDIIFTTATKEINITTITNFDSYTYSRDIIKLEPEEKEEIDYMEIDGNIFPVYYTYYDYSENNYKELLPKKDTTVKQKIIVEKGIVKEDVILNNKNF